MQSPLASFSQAAHVLRVRACCVACVLHCTLEQRTLARTPARAARAKNTPQTRGPFRYLRILQRGPTSSGSFFLVLSCIEVYGRLYSVSAAGGGGGGGGDDGFGA